MSMRHSHIPASKRSWLFLLKGLSLVVGRLNVFEFITKLLRNSTFAPLSPFLSGFLSHTLMQICFLVERLQCQVFVEEGPDGKFRSIRVTFTPTVPHCHLATLIGMSEKCSFTPAKRWGFVQVRSSFLFSKI